MATKEKQAKVRVEYRLYRDNVTHSCSEIPSLSVEREGGFNAVHCGIISTYRRRSVSIVLCCHHG